MNYQSFIESKILEVPNEGFEGYTAHENTFPHQADTVRWALNGGKRAVFCSFGLGKTVIQLEIATSVCNHTGKPFLIGLPLGVVSEFKDDGKNILGVEVHYVRNQAEAVEVQSRYDKPQIFLSNYDRIRDWSFDPEWFGGCSFDEGDAIRNLETKTSDYIINEMSKIKYRFIATATPAPNEYTEILNYAQFLGVCDRGQALTRFFKRDSTKAGNLTLYDHKQKEFWIWVRSWAIFLEKPSDLGYRDDGYVLPKLNIHYHEVKVTDREVKYDRDGNVVMYDDASKSLSAAAKEKQESLKVRCEKAVEVVTASDRNFIIWHDLENERKALESLMKGKHYKSVYGSQKLEDKETLLNGFKKGEFKYLLTKPSIAGSGCNFQAHCADAVFVGIGWKFKDFIQAIHRILRFRQFAEEVNIHLIYTDAEIGILRDLERKWRQHNETMKNMTSLMKLYGLDQKSSINILKRSMEVERMEYSGEDFKLIRNDCVVELSGRKDNSVQMFLSSFPFSDQYEYCELYQDFGHNNGNDEFFKQCDFLVPEMYRTLEPGRIAAIHVKNRIRFSYQNGVGFSSLKDFRGEVVMNFEKHGFFLLGEHYITTDVVRENNQTYRLGWSENAKDGTKMGGGLPEYLLIFRKPPSDTSNAYADRPVVKSKEVYSRGRWQLDAHSLWRSNGDRLLSSQELRKYDLGKIGKWWKEYLRNGNYDFEDHVAICEELDRAGKLPSTFMAMAPWVHLENDAVWDDVNRMNTLNTSQALRKKEQHVCPLQFDIVDRAIERYSNPGDLVYDPFGGLGTVPLRAIIKGRKGESTELNEIYWKDSCQYLKEYDYKRSVPTLFAV